MGEHASRFMDILQSTGQSVWQLLSIHPPGKNNSPYASASGFAGDVNLLDSARPVHAFTSGGLIEFRKNNPWVHDWAMFLIAKTEHDGAPWYEWDEKIRARDPEQLENLRDKCRREYWNHIGEQLSFEIQWTEFQSHAEKRGIELIGDFPLYVAVDSADVWANQHLFNLEEHMTLDFNWDSHNSEGYSWLVQRLAVSLRRFSRVRINQLSSLEKITEEIKDGLFSAMRNKIGEYKIIAENQGEITEKFDQMCSRHNFSRMAVLHFGFTGSQNNLNHPDNISKHAVCYTSSHDNDTTVGWYTSVDQETRNNISQSLDRGIVDKSERPIHRQLMRSALSCEAGTTIIPLQDVMGLDSGARMFDADKSEQNWEWQFMWVDLSQNHLNWLAAATESTNRWSGVVKKESPTVSDEELVRFSGGLN